MSAVDFAVLGGGIAGLTAARELLRRGYRVTLLERAPVVGGLARTLELRGFRFDIGGHRFHSNNPAVLDWLRALLGDDLLSVPRTSHIHLNGRYVDYPLTFPDALTAFTPPQAAHMLASYGRARLLRHGRDDRSFEDWVVNRFGREMYRHFFQPYTEKVWGIPCDALSAAWAAQRIGIPSLARAVKQAFFPPDIAPATAVSRFYYPRYGFGMIPVALADDIARRGGAMLTQAIPQRLEPAAGGWRVCWRPAASGERPVTLYARRVVSTIPLGALLRLLPDAPTPDLAYRGLIGVFLALDRPRVSADSWTYFPDPALLFGRTHEPKNWSPAMVPHPDMTSLGVEIFAGRDDAVWRQSDAALLARVVTQLSGLGWLRPEEVIHGRVLRVPHAYPIYRVGYEQTLTAVLAWLARFAGLHLVGRTGSFRYMNSDGVIEDVFRFLNGLGLSTAVGELPKIDGRWV